jgi:hypothetical protein
MKAEYGGQKEKRGKRERKRNVQKHARYRKTMDEKREVSGLWIRRNEIVGDRDKNVKVIKRGQEKGLREQQRTRGYEEKAKSMTG